MYKKYKRLITFVFVTVFLLLLFPQTTLAAGIYDESDLISALNSGGNHTLELDVTVTSAAAVSSGATINLDMNGKTITFEQPLSVNGTLNISGTGTIYRADVAALQGQYVIYVNSGGSLTLNDATLNGNALATSERSFVRVLAGGIFEMNSGSIINNYVNYNSNGGGVLVDGNFIMNGGTINGNRACRGGGVSIGTSGIFYFHGGTISNNQAIRRSNSGGLGGGVYANGMIYMDSAQALIDSNTAYDGGGVALNSGGAAPGAIFNFSAGTISGNSVPSANTSTDTRRNGGGIWTSENIYSVVNMTGGIVTGNTACYGAGLSINSVGSQSTISGGEIQGNTAVAFGGGLSVEDGGSLAISGNTIISGNDASAGGGISVYSNFSNTTAVTYVTVGSNVQIINNTANGGEGGGIYIPALGNVTVDGATITGNSAQASGGGVYVGAAFPIITSSFTLSSGALYGNTSDLSGADMATAVYANTNIIPATSMGRPVSEVDGWYWDMDGSRFASMSVPSEYTPNQTGVIDIIAESIIVATPTPQITPTPVPSAVIPATGDQTNLPILLIVMAGGVAIVAIVAVVLVFRSYIRTKNDNAE